MRKEFEIHMIRLRKYYDNTNTMIRTKQLIKRIEKRAARTYVRDDHQHFNNFFTHFNFQNDTVDIRR